jgi:hypothetical protein
MPKIYLGSPILMDMARYYYSILLLFRRLYKRLSSFTFNGRKYIYFEHPYNGTWMNERSIEIPLMWEQVTSCLPDTVLEVGNVLSHYFEIKHLVVDKYEHRQGVINDDIVNVEFSKEFDCIISISTLEHIGWDEVPRVPGKHIQAIEKMKQLLSANGKLIATIPLGYNPHFDQDILNEKLGCYQVFYFKRLAKDRWQETSIDQVRQSQYRKKYRSTDGLAVCVWHKG